MRHVLPAMPVQVACGLHQPVQCSVSTVRTQFTVAFERPNESPITLRLHYRPHPFPFPSTHHISHTIGQAS
jgi:hypothetical protein